MQKSFQFTWSCKANVNQFKPMQHLPKSSGCFNVSSFAKQQMKEAYRLQIHHHLSHQQEMSGFFNARNLFNVPFHTEVGTEQLQLFTRRPGEYIKIKDFVTQSQREAKDGREGVTLYSSKRLLSRDGSAAGFRNSSQLRVLDFLPAAVLKGEAEVLIPYCKTEH